MPEAHIAHRNGEEDGPVAPPSSSAALMAAMVFDRSRLGGILNFYYRSAA
jgi:hypothetical protein